jgi:hypothetical protein
MERYMIESSHDREDCLHVLDEFVVYGHITHFDWGCENGVCKGWAIVEADSPEEALLCVPALVRNKATVTKLSKFSPEKIQEFHEEL